MREKRSAAPPRPRDPRALAVAIDLRLPRVTGRPEVVAEEIARRVSARELGFVYVSAFVRRMPRRRRRGARILPSR